MVLKLKRFIVETYVRRRHQHGGKFYVLCQKRHLSDMVPFKKKKPFREKFNDLVQWYDEFTGMDEVRSAQRRVLEDEENFRNSQEVRRNVLTKLKAIQFQLKELYTELDTTNRGDERYVTLVTQEHKLLKEEKVILEEFANAEKNERDFFTALSTSVKLSHEKERAQSERTKYWSIIGSIMGTVIGILGTSINSHFRMNELKQLIQQSSDKQLLHNLNNYLESNEKLLTKFKDNMILEENSGFDKLEAILKNLDNRITNVEGSLKTVEKHSKTVPKIITVSETEYNKVAVPVETLSDTIKKEYTQTKMLLFTLAILSIIMPIITRYS